MAVPQIQTIAPNIQKNPRLVRKAILFTALGVTSYFAIRGIVKLLTPDANREQGKATENELDQLNTNANTRQTLTQSQVLALANKLFQAMDGYGTDENSILSAFYSLRNNADFLALIAAFGTREISSGSWNPEANFNGTLTAALANELDIEYIIKLNNILKAKKITYRV
jgi:hypothetical protein